MNPPTSTPSKLIAFLIGGGLLIGLASWDQKQTQSQYESTITDTTPKKKTTDKKVRDLDDVLTELENVEWIDANKLQLELNEALKGLNLEKIQKQVALEMKNIDFEKIMKEAKASIAAIDFEKINKEIAEAMKGISIDKEIKASLEKINWEDMKEELEKVKEVEMKKVQEELEKVKVEMKDLGPKIKEEVEKAKGEILEFKSFIGKLHDAGLLNKNGTYTLKHKDGVLTVNGKAVSNEVYQKHNEFLLKHKNFNIEKSTDDFDMNQD